MQLTRLDEYMSKVGSDIKQFKQHVKLLVKGLSAHGNMTTDLLINLFKGYKKAKDQQFVKYIQNKENLCDKGTVITADALMTYALEKYKVLNDKDV